ncbi:MAG: acyl-phosphate glycerol 3-phosphate acyltransferase [Bacteroidetes bacterium RIFCSPLOWO2_12_FULL_35_15]|nr:MAG: acyl-phosphate glycerol 3-phosphate acyltransferase [Bacteroidetes bacterium RIFCSPLOWO2_12_FULL_35_15]
MINSSNIILLIFAYLLGSIPSAVWIGKFFYKIDVREYGSGNAGATNVFRVLGKKAGIPVTLIDVLKGYAAVSLAHFSNYTPGSNQFINLELVLGIASLVGHIFPLFASFRGGKGIATLLGIILCVHPYAAFISIGIFILVLLVSSYVSLSSMISAIMFPIIVIFVFKTKVPSLIIFSVLIAIMVLITHQKNIERLLRREESKSKLIKKKKTKLPDEETEK